MDDTLLNRANQVKYMGIIIDHKLNWKQHITKPEYFKAYLV